MKREGNSGEGSAAGVDWEGNRVRWYLFLALADLGRQVFKMGGRKELLNKACKVPKHCSSPRIRDGYVFYQGAYCS